jgi:hypothetical protein
MTSITPRGGEAGALFESGSLRLRLKGKGRKLLSLTQAEHDEFRWVREEEVQELAITTEEHRGVIMNSFRLRRASIEAIGGKGVDQSDVGV